MSNITLKLAGADNKDYDIDYFNIISCEKSGAHTLLLVKGGRDQTEKLSIAMPVDKLRSRINDMESYIKKLKEITYDNLSGIERRYIEFFIEKKSKITDYVAITWSQPVEIRFAADKSLAPEIMDEIKEKFLTVEE
ncbi:MAG TPA: hypothetical protein VGN20_17110 [Mucilaginibacter sp.]|jgi:hypothetical protein